MNRLWFIIVLALIGFGLYFLKDYVDKLFGTWIADLVQDKKNINVTINKIKGWRKETISAMTNIANICLGILLLYVVSIGYRMIKNK